MNFQKLLERLNLVAKHILEWEDPIHIGYSNNCDAWIASSIFGRIFYDLKKPCVIFAIEDDINKSLDQKYNYPLILIGLSIDRINNIDLSKNLIFISSANKVENSNPERHLFINDFGFTSNDISLSAISYFICSVLTENLDYIVRLPLIASQTKNLYSEYTGLHKIIADDAKMGGILEVTKGFSILGQFIFNIKDALVYSQFPILPGLTGNENRISLLLSKSNIETMLGNTDRKIGDLSKEELKELNSELILNLSKNKGYQEEELVFIKTLLKFTDESTNTIVYNNWDFAVAIKDAMNQHRNQDAIAVLMGNRSDKLLSLQKLYTDERRSALISFQFILDHKEDIIDLSALRYFIADKKIAWYNVSITATMALSNGLVDSDLPFAIIAPGPGDLFSLGICASKNHNLKISLLDLVNKIIENRKLDTIAMGSKLKAMFTIKEDEILPILLDVNSKLKGEL